jgi:hypothetical protein
MVRVASLFVSPSCLKALLPHACVFSLLGWWTLRERESLSACLYSLLRFVFVLFFKPPGRREGGYVGECECR